MFAKIVDMLNRFIWVSVSAFMSIQYMDSCAKSLVLCRLSSVPIFPIFSYVLKLSPIFPIFFKKKTLFFLFFQEKHTYQNLANGPTFILNFKKLQKITLIFLLSKIVFKLWLRDTRFWVQQRSINSHPVYLLICHGT